MESISSYYILKSDKSSIFTSKINQLQSQQSITNSTFFFFSSEILNINGNLLFTGDKLFMDFEYINFYNDTDFFISNINTKNLLRFNVYDAHIFGDSIYDTYNFTLKSNNVNLNANTTTYTSRLHETNVIFYNLNANIITFNGLQNLEINTTAANFKSNSIFLHPKPLFEITCSNISFISNNQDFVIKREYFNSNEIRFSAINSLLKSETLYFKSESLLELNNMNTNITNDRFQIILNENKKLNLKSPHSIEFKPADILTIQSFDQTYTSRHHTIKSENILFGASQQQFSSNNFDVILNDKFNLNSRQNVIRGNVNLRSNVMLISNAVILTSEFIRLSTNNHGIRFMQGNLISKNVHAVSNVLFSGNLFALKLNSFEINGNVIRIHSNSFIGNCGNGSIFGNKFNITSNYLNTLTADTDIITHAFLVDSSHQALATDTQHFFSNIHSINPHIYKVQSNNTVITASNIQSFSNDVWLQGNVNVSSNFLNVNSNKSNLKIGNFQINSNQFISNVQLLLGKLDNTLNVRNNQFNLYSSEQINIKTNLFSNTEYTTIQNKDTNILAIEFQNNATAFNIKNPVNIEINTQNTLRFIGNSFSTIASINQINGHQISNIFSNFIQLNSNIDFSSKINHLRFSSNTVYLKSNILKIDSPLSIYSNNFVLNGNNTFNLFKMTTADALRIINSNYNLTNFHSFLSTFDRGNIFVSNMICNYKNTIFLSNQFFVDNSNTFELNANINSLTFQDFSFHGNNVYIRSKDVSMNQNNLIASSNILRLGGNLSLVSNLGNFNLSNCNFTVDQLGLATPNLIINGNKTFVIKGNNLNVQSNNLVNANGIIEINLNMNHAIIKSNVDAVSNDIFIKSNLVELSQTSFSIINPGKSNIQMDHTTAVIGLNQFNLQFQNTNLFNSGNMQMAHSNTISIECFGFHGLNADRVANITGNIVQFNNFNSQIIAGKMQILFEKANIVSNANFLTDYTNQVSITSQDWNMNSTNHTLINSNKFYINQNMVILTTFSFLKIDGSIQVASLSNQTNMTASNSFSMRSNALISNTHIFNINSNHQFSIESTDLAATLRNSNIQSKGVILNANDLFITSNNISASSNDRIQINTSKLIQNSNKVDISLVNGNLRSNQLLITSNNLNYAGIDLNINANSANINCRRQADVDFTNNTFITANNLLMNSVLSVFDVFTFDLKNDTSVRKRLFIPELNPLGNTLHFLNSEKLNLLNGYYMVNGNIGFNPSSNVMINIGTDNCVLNLKGALNYINTNDFEFNSRHIFFNSNAVGSGTAQGAGIYIRDNNYNGKSFILVSDNGLGYTFKPPETENTFKLQFDSFYANGFLKCIRDGPSPFYILQPETLQIGTVGLLTTALNNKLNLSGGTMTGNLIMGANKITSSNTNTDPRDISNLTYASTKLPLSGGTMTGSIEMNNSKISSTFAPVSNSDLVNKHHLDSNKLSLAGGTLSGNLDLQEFRMSSNFVASANSDLTNRKFLYDTFLPWVGGTMKGNIVYVNSSFKITSNYVASAKHDITNKLYVDSSRINPNADVVMLGNIIMGGTTKLTSNFDTTANTDITNKKYTDDHFFKLVGGNLMGNLHMGQNFKISSNHVPIFNTDITNRKYVIDNFLNISGGGMRGNVVMSSNLKLASNYLAFANSDLTNKEFMDKNLVFLKVNNILKGNVHLESNKLTSNYRATDKWDIVNKKYTDERLVFLNGGTLNGNIIMGNTFKLASNFTPIANSDITNKQYLDINFFNLRGNTLTGNLNMSGLFKISSNYTASSNSDITNKLFLDSNVLKLKGGSMLGHIRMVDKKITTIATPAQNSDLTNKLYADTKFSVLGGDLLSGNLLLNSNLVLTQQSRIIHKNGTVPFRGNVLLRSSNVSVGGNMICHNLPVVLNKILYSNPPTSNSVSPIAVEARSENFTPSDIVLAMNVSGGFYVNPSVPPSQYNPQANVPTASSIKAEVFDNQDNLIGASINNQNSFRNTIGSSSTTWSTPSFETSQLTFSFPSNVILFKNKTYYVKFSSTNSIPFLYLPYRATPTSNPTVAGVFHVLESPSQGDQLINKFYMDTKVDLKSNGSANNVVMQGNLIINNGFIRSNRAKNIQFNANLLLSEKNTLFSNNIFNPNTFFNTALQIGSTNTNLRITGGINRGSLLVGNTVSTTELPVGENNSICTTNYFPNELQTQIVGTRNIIYLDANGTIIDNPILNGTTVYIFTDNATITPKKDINDVRYLVIGGGGSGGFGIGEDVDPQGIRIQLSPGGGGGGGFLTNFQNSANPNPIKLNGKTSYTIMVGAGGNNSNGSPSVLQHSDGSITAIGGGRGGEINLNGSNGASGGGGGSPLLPIFGGTLTQPGSGSNGNPGSSGRSTVFGGATGVGRTAASGGGGGAGTRGSELGGGDGIASGISGVNQFYAGGGGGFNSSWGRGVGRGNNPFINERMRGGAGGGGSFGTRGTPGTGGGGGGNALGGSGIVILRFPSFVNSANIGWWDRTMTQNVDNSIENANVILSNNNQNGLFRSNLIWNNKLLRLSTPNLFVKNMFISDNMPNRFNANTCLSKQFFDDGIVIQKLVVSNLTTTQQTLFPVLSSNVGNQRLSIQKSNSSSVSTTTSLILRMDTLSVGNQITVPVASVAGFSINSIVYLTYNAANFIRGRVVSITSNNLLLEILNIQRNFLIETFLNNTTNQKTIQTINGLGIDKTSPSDFFSIPSANSKSQIVYTLCDVNGNELPTNSPLNGYLTVETPPTSITFVNYPLNNGPLSVRGMINQPNGGSETLRAESFINFVEPNNVVNTISATLPGVQVIPYLYKGQSGINWISRTSGLNRRWNSVAYGNGLWVAVGDVGSLMTSSDGINWTSRTSANNNNWSSVAYGNGLWVAVSSSGTGNRVMTSPDGITWTSRTSATNNNWSSVAYGNGLWVAVSFSGTGNRVMTSPDGITWTSRTSASNNNWTSVAYGNGLWVVVSNNFGASSGNRVMTSPDGINWTTRTSAADNDWTSVAYGNGLWVAVSGEPGSGNRVMTSPDGITWTTRTSAANVLWYEVAYGDGLWVAVSYSNAADRRNIMVSSNGFDWILLSQQPTASSWTSVAYGNGLWVVLGVNDTFMTSTPDFNQINSYGIDPSLNGINVPINCAQVNGVTRVIFPTTWLNTSNNLGMYRDLVIQQANLPASLIGQNPILHFIDLWVPTNNTLRVNIDIYLGTSDRPSAYYWRNLNDMQNTVSFQTAGDGSINVEGIGLTPLRIYAVDLLAMNGMSFIRPFQGGATSFRVSCMLIFNAPARYPCNNQLGTNLPAMTVNMSRCDNIMTNAETGIQKITMSVSPLTLANASKYCFGFLPLGITNSFRDVLRFDQIVGGIRYTSSLQYLSTQQTQQNVAALNMQLNKLFLNISRTNTVLDNPINYTIKAAINSVDFVYINLTISRSVTPPGVRFAFSNNTSKSSANISWTLPSSAPVYILNQFQSVFFLKSSFVITEVSKYIIGRDSSNQVIAITAKYNVLDKSSNKIGETIFGTSTTNLTELLSFTMNDQTSTCIIPNNFEFVIQVEPYLQQPNIRSYEQYVSTSGNTLIGVIKGYSIDYTVGTIRLDTSNTNDIVSYRPDTNTLGVYSLSTANIPTVLLNPPPIPTANQALITKSFVNNAIRTNVNNLNITPTNIIRNNIVALYNFNNNAFDSSGNNNNLTNVNSVIYSYDPGRRAVANFNGGNFFQINNDGRFSPDNFTVACWIKPQPNNTLQTIASCRNTSPTLSGWMINISPTNDLEFWTGNAGSIWNTVRLINAFGNLTNWVHIAITYNKSTRNLIFYMNGIFNSFFTVGYTNNNGSNLRIGAGRNESQSVAEFLAPGTLMDQFSFYNRVLNVYEMYDIYNFNSSQFVLPVLHSNKQVFSTDVFYNEYTNMLNVSLSLIDISRTTTRCRLNEAPTSTVLGARSVSTRSALPAGSSTQLSVLAADSASTTSSLMYNDFIKILNGWIGIGSLTPPNFPLDIQSVVNTSPATLTDAPLNANAIPIATLCCSYDGNRVYEASGTQLFFRQLLVSGTSQSQGVSQFNFGNTLRSVSCSPNGRYVFVITQNNVFISVNFGVNFTTITASTGTTYRNLSGTAFMTETSANNDTLYGFATEHGGILRRFSGVFNTTSNSFTTPMTNNLTMTITTGSPTQSSLFFFRSGTGPSMALSDDLNNLYIVATLDLNTSVIKVSNLKNSVLPFERLVSLPINRTYKAVACSSTGSIVYALEENLLWRSTDAGNTFQYYPTPTQTAASIRAQFQFQSAFRDFTRNNGGSITVAGPYTSVSCDRTGNFISLCSNRFLPPPSTITAFMSVSRSINSAIDTISLNGSQNISFSQSTSVSVVNNEEYRVSFSGSNPTISIVNSSTIRATYSMSWNIPNFFSQFGSFTTSSRFFLDGWTLESSVGTWGNEGLASILPGSNPPQFVTVPYRYPRAAGFLSAYVIIKIGSSNAALSNISRIDWYGVATVHGTNRNARRVNVYTSNIELTVNSPFQGTFRGSFDVDINSNFSSPSSFHSNMSFNWIYFEVVSNWGDRDTTKVDRIEFIGGSSNSFTTTVSTNNGTFYQSGSSFLFRASSTVAQSESSIITSSNQGESWNQNLQSVRTNGNAWVFISTAKNNFRRVFAYNLGLFNLFTSAISGESCRVSGAVRSSDRISSSDKRIKMNTHAIDANTSSDIIKVHPKKYQFISQNKPIIGFIAQDVDSIYPQAVQIMPKIIPNFMSHVVISHHSNHIFKVMNAIHSNQFKFISNAPLENQRYKIQFKDIQTNNHFYAWTAGDGIFEKHFFIEINDPNFIPGLYVLIGQEINDCHTLNADALFSIGVAHIQKMVDKQKTENNRISLLKNKYVSLQKLIEKQNELIDALVK